MNDATNPAAKPIARLLAATTGAGNAANRQQTMQAMLTAPMPLGQAVMIQKLLTASSTATARRPPSAAVMASPCAT